ncbi:hypothetical protein MJO28_008873 [Puccinia striiformis f. sp. tritici]|uniref:DASH complex subunit ASK1 n=4 Tax=Puccinia striiformis TaxID=27350 RepID=A0A0L0VEK5_9BASI|nr:hypothetical protein Pst134EA_015086 [Puccinia striiformis f. sp. tritici]KAH9462997.1 hypothetical protein Pst134EA_015086 [Puccinia striiformis f. sp. tritici]KAI7950052.1 hypothetical protein MJO28_008873 [Puccinia striiformis f. sp. tritici]KAI7953117.1 hypothetical protein MJO29_008748 [Puccinia striiformis f. sp. tritici]KNE97626.1 hypothetical protein PSTG_09031 [Puccinia striiformis f. sp. tritici PST-78]
MSSSSSRRSFYDPKQPRLLTEDEIAQMSPAECDAACLQIDQISVNILQNIDADFGKSHRIITDKILPDLERYGEASKGIWEGLKFWQGFFEASANVKLSGNNEESEAGSTSQIDNDRTQQTEENSMQTTLQPHEENDFDSRMADQTAPDSPFENLKQDLRQNLGIPAKSSSAVLQDVRPVQQADDSQQTGSSGSLRRPPHWHDLSMDSPDVTLQMPVPRDLSMLIDGQSGISLDSDISMSSFIAQESEEDRDQKSKKTEPTHPQTRKSLGHGANILLHQALLRDTMSGKHKRQTISTPAKSRSHRGSMITGLPVEVADPGWNGLTDLRKVPLDGFVGSSKKIHSRPYHPSGEQSGTGFSEEDTEDSIRAGISPPQTIHFSVPRSKLAKTPSKEAARLITQDVLETARFRAGYANPLDLEDSSFLEPPSVLRDWKTRGYDTLLVSQVENEEKEAELNQFKPSSSTSAFAGCSSDAGPSRDLSVSRALIDLRDGDAQSSSNRGVSTMNSQRSDRNDPFNGPSTIKQRPGQISGVLGGQSNLGHQLRSMPMDDSMESPPDSPTLFGIRHDPKKNPTQASSVPLVDPARPNNPTRTSQPFVPMRPEEMDTFFGGNLLESECFEPSPLQGKRMRYTDPKDPKDPKGP